MIESLRERAERGIWWSFVDAFGVRGVQFTIGVVLARLLLPEEFGLIGMLFVFMGIAQSFLSSGFGSALIQKKSVTIEDTSSVFYFNLIMGVVLAGSLFYLSPLIALFFGQEILTPLARALSLTIVFGSFGIVQTALLTRNLDFKTQTKISLISGATSGIIGVTLAYNGFGVWSLVAQQVSASLFQSCLLFLFTRWRPAITFSFESLREMFTFGSRLLVSGLLNQIFDNIYYVVIGRFFSPAALGFYTRANSLQELPSATLCGIVGRVSFPIFATIQDDKEKLRNGLRKALRLLVFVNSPVMIGLAAVSAPFVSVVFGAKWLPCVPYLQLLTVLGFLLPLHLLNLSILMAMGRSELFLRLEIIKKCLILINILATYWIGIIAMIIGQILVSMFCYFLNSYYTGKLINYSAKEQVYDLWKYGLSSGVMGVGVHLVSYVEFPNAVSQLATQVCVGVLLYYGAAALLKLPALEESRMIVSHRIKKVKP